MNERLSKLGAMAWRIRIRCLESIYLAGSGHPGGSFSAAEIMSVLYFDRMNISPDDPYFPGRDRFVLSKGHVAPVLYATLALRGFFPVEELKTLRRLDSRLSGHPAYGKLPGVDMVSGSLGQGLSIGLGMRQAGRVKGENFNVFVLMGDGEIQEGSVWEAAMAAAHFKIDHLIAVLDNNHLQLDGSVSQIMEVAPLVDKWKSFGWRVLQCDGHDIAALDAAFGDAVSLCGDGPVIIIADTIKGKGVSFMENNSAWHGACPSAEEYEKAMKELNEGLEAASI